MAAPDFTVANPTMGAAGQLYTTLGDQAVTGQRIRTDAATASTRALADWQTQLPQLQSGIAANGQYYSSAERAQEGTAYRKFAQGYGDIQSAAQRQLDDLTRQRTYAAMGLVI